MLFTFSLCPAKLISAFSIPTPIYKVVDFRNHFPNPCPAETVSAPQSYTLYIRQNPFPNPCPAEFISAPLHFPIPIYKE